jgi:hypothetical protein
VYKPFTYFLDFIFLYHPFKGLMHVNDSYSIISVASPLQSSQVLHLTSEPDVTSSVNGHTIHSNHSGVVATSPWKTQLLSFAKESK